MEWAAHTSYMYANNKHSCETNARWNTCVSQFIHTHTQSQELANSILIRWWHCRSGEKSNCKWKQRHTVLYDTIQLVFILVSHTFPPPSAIYQWVCIWIEFTAIIKVWASCWIYTNFSFSFRYIQYKQNLFLASWI